MAPDEDEPTVFDDEAEDYEPPSNGDDSRDWDSGLDFDSDDGSSFTDLGMTHSQWCDAQEYDRR